jgi:hypothetical protein
MKLKLLQLERRNQELEAIADEILVLTGKQHADEPVQFELNTKGQRWYRGAREILLHQKSSSLGEFDACYVQVIKDVITGNVFAVGNWMMYTEFRSTLGALA